MSAIATRPLIAQFIAVGFAITAVLGCGRKQDVQPESFAGDWQLFEDRQFNIYVPPHSARGHRAMMSYGAACNEILDQVVTYFDLDIVQPFSIYLFNTDQECRDATGHPAGFVEGFNIYTRIGDQIGGAIAISACHAIDPQAPSFTLIKDGIHTLFDRMDINVHHEARQLLQESRLHGLAELVAADSLADREAHDIAAGSFTAFLLQRFGVDRFKMLWRSVLDLPQSLERIYGLPLPQLSDEWLIHLDREAKRT
ncbi:MAG TPA: hypothetical protein VGB22_08175 [candidate division Zixibacteria bacterium]|jgi:hypothetical protein